MKIVDVENLKLNNSIVTIGKFDCIHIGHQLLLDTAAKENDGSMETIMLTFDINPASFVLNKDIKRLTSREERVNICKGLGVNKYIEYPFSDNIRNMSPEEFVKEILVDKLGTKVVVCGDDFCFGKNRAGNPEKLTELGKKYGFRVKVVERLKYKDDYVSSTRIRDSLVVGEIADVNEMLGRVYSLSGRIEQGNHVGRKNEVPTINFEAPEQRVLPPNGVYATKTKIGENTYISITNIGTRPTFYDSTKKYVETFILDFNGDLYGEEAQILFYEYVRPEKDFGSSEKLYQQIEKDVQRTRQFFDNLDNYGK